MRRHKANRCEYALLLALDDSTLVAEARHEAERADSNFDFSACHSALVATDILVYAEERNE